MWLRLRQIAGVAEKLAPVEADLCDILGIAVCYRDPGVGYFGLENALFPIGDQLLEIVAPLREGTAGGRYLARRGGDGGYMVITQCDNHGPRRARVDELGVRIVHDQQSDEFVNMQLHPRDTGGTFFEIDQQLGERSLELDGPWHPAGPDWQRAKLLEKVKGIAAAEIQCDDPSLVANRWAEIAEGNIEHTEGTYSLTLDNATVRFVTCFDGRPEGLGGIDLLTGDRDAILAAADRREKITGPNQITIGGIRMNLL